MQFFTSKVERAQEALSALRGARSSGAVRVLLAAALDRLRELLSLPGGAGLCGQLLLRDAVTFRAARTAFDADTAEVLGVLCDRVVDAIARIQIVPADDGATEPSILDDEGLLVVVTLADDALADVPGVDDALAAKIAQARGEVLLRLGRPGAAAHAFARARARLESAFDGTLAAAAARLDRAAHYAS